MGGARTPSADSWKIDEDADRVAQSSVPPSMTRQRRVIEPWKTLEPRKAQPGESVRPLVRAHVKVVPKSNRLARAVSAVFNALVLVTLFGGVAAALWRFAHRAAGWRLVPLAHAAFDGSSAVWSGVATLVTIAATIALALMANYARPRSMGYLVAALGMLLVAVSTAVIAFSIGPDGLSAAARRGTSLVAWALPFVPLGVALRTLRNAWAALAYGSGMERVHGAVHAALAGAWVFASVELFFGAGLGRVLAALHP